MNRTDICNMALSIISRQRINSLDEDSEEAKECKVYYDHTRRRLLKMFPWGFAKRTEKLALRTDTVPGWSYCYGYPSECISVLFVFDDDHADRREMERQDFYLTTISGNDRVICSDTKDAWAEFTYDVKEPDMFSEEFTEALVRMMAANLAGPLAGNSDLMQVNAQLANQSISIAMQENMMEQERHTMYPRKYADARFQ